MAKITKKLKKMFKPQRFGPKKLYKKVSSSKKNEGC